jgi:hypothetical protein
VTASIHGQESAATFIILGATAADIVAIPGTALEILGAMVGVTRHAL